MILATRQHPSGRRLTAFATGDLPHRSRARVARHLLTCVSCREVVGAIVTLCERAADLSNLTARSDLADGVLERRAAGERMILPSMANSASPGKWSRTRLAAALLVAASVVLAMVMTWPPPAGAVALSGELRFLPDAGSPGSVVRILYNAPRILADEPVLHLRGRWRAGDPATGMASTPPLVVAQLRGGEGVYSGELQIPDSAVYGIFAVEDPAGESLDTNLGRYWELLTGDGSGTVSFGALRARWTELLRNSFGRAYEVVRGATERFPGSAQAWEMLAYLEQSLLEGVSADSSRALHARRLAEFHHAAARRYGVSPAEMGALYQYARRLGDTARSAFWRDRLLEEAPDSRIAVQERIVVAFRAHWQAEPAAALDSVEALWRSTSAERPLLAQQGLVLARRIGEPIVIRRWAARSADAAPAGAVSVALGLAAIPALRSEAIESLRSLAASAEAQPRPLGITVAEHAMTEREARATSLAALGRALLLAGDTVAAAQKLATAADLAWSSQVFEAAVPVLLAVGDTIGSHRNAARIVADPATPPERRSALDVAARAAAGEAAWNVLLDSARVEMRERTLAGATLRSLSGKARLWTPSGEETSLADVLRGMPVVLTVISRYCGYSLEELPELAAFSRAMQARGVAVIAVSSDPLSAGLSRLLERKNVDVPLYHDLRGEINDALQAWETPTYYVVDGDGRLRFAKSLRINIPRQVEALRAQERPARSMQGKP